MLPRETPFPRKDVRKTALNLLHCLGNALLQKPVKLLEYSSFEETLKDSGIKIFPQVRCEVEV